jgi:hypothetical protein
LINGMSTATQQTAANRKTWQTRPP